MTSDYDNVDRQNSNTVEKGDSVVDNIKSEKSIIIENEKSEEIYRLAKDEQKKEEKKDEKENDGESSESICSVIDENTPYEEPAKFFSMFNCIRMLMKFTMS